MKKCEICGKDFEPKESYHRKCPECFRSDGPQGKNSYAHRGSPPSEKAEPIEKLFLKSYYDQKGDLLEAIFIDIPEKLAAFFSKHGLKTKQLREFFKRASHARNIALLKGIDASRSILNECIPHAKYQTERKIIPVSFKKFIDHHIPIAKESEKMLEGFYKHFDSIVCYFPKEKGGKDEA